MQIVPIVEILSKIIFVLSGIEIRSLFFLELIFIANGIQSFQRAIIMCVCLFWEVMHFADAICLRKLEHHNFHSLMVKREALRVMPRGKQRLTVYRAHQV